MTWLTDDDWARAQKVLPIAVVDIAPLRGAKTAIEIGLIRRETPHQGERWNLVGGRILRGESVGDAIRRQLRETLGDGVKADVSADVQPHYVAQYGPIHAKPFSYDPRKHAIGLTFAIQIDGEIVPQGEARGFEWFAAQRLPPREAWGFEQDRPAEACLRAAGVVIDFLP